MRWWLEELANKNHGVEKACEELGGVKGRWRKKIVFHCVAFYCIVLFMHCLVIHFIVFCCIVLLCTVLYSVVLYCIATTSRRCKSLVLETMERVFK